MEQKLTALQTVRLLDEVSGDNASYGPYGTIIGPSADKANEFEVELVDPFVAYEDTVAFGTDYDKTPDVVTRPGESLHAVYPNDLESALNELATAKRPRQKGEDRRIPSKAFEQAMRHMFCAYCLNRFGPRTLEAFRVRLAEDLLGLDSLMAAYIAKTVGNTSPYDWYELCLRRSVIQILSDVYGVGTATPEELLALETRIRQVGEKTEEGIRRVLPSTFPVSAHQWWQQQLLPISTATCDDSLESYFTNYFRSEDIYDRDGSVFDGLEDTLEQNAANIAKSLTTGLSERSVLIVAERLRYHADTTGKDIVDEISMMSEVHWYDDDRMKTFFRQLLEAAADNVDRMKK